MVCMVSRHPHILLPERLRDVLVFLPFRDVLLLLTGQPIAVSGGDEGIGKKAAGLK
jgi:hypothetical protein